MKKVKFEDSYNYVLSQKGTYALCFDMVRLSKLNEVSNELGDIALKEAIRRIKDVTTDNMLSVRIGGDEFILFTGLYNIEDVVKLREKVIAQNEKTVKYDSRQYPVSLDCGIIQITENIRYSELFTKVQNAIIEEKRKR